MDDKLLQNEKGDHLGFCNNQRNNIDLDHMAAVKCGKQEGSGKKF